MAFARTDLAQVATGGGNSIYILRSNDTAIVVDGAGYFNLANEMLTVGDLIYGILDIDGTPTFGLGVVLSNAAGVVDLSDFTALGGTDTD